MVWLGRPPVLPSDGWGWSMDRDLCIRPSHHWPHLLIPNIWNGFFYWNLPYRSLTKMMLVTVSPGRTWPTEKGQRMKCSGRVWDVVTRRQFACQRTIKVSSIWSILIIRHWWSSAYKYRPSYSLHGIPSRLFPFHCTRPTHGSPLQTPFSWQYPARRKLPELLKTECSGMNSYPLLQYRGSIIELYGQKKMLISALCYSLCVKNRPAGYSLLSWLRIVFLVGWFLCANRPLAGHCRHSHDDR